MAKKNITIPVESEVETTGTELAIITPSFNKVAEFKMPNLEESLIIIAEKRKEYSTLVIDGVDDKPGYESVKVAMGQMKDDRIAFVKSATENVIDPTNTYLSQFKKDLEKIANEFKAGEQELREKKNFIDDEKARLKAEAELEKVRVMQIRVNDLNVLGAVFDGKVYTYPYSQALVVTAADVKDFDDDKFNAFLGQVKEAHSAEQKRITDKKAADDEAAEAERLRLLKEEEELLQRQAEIDRQANENKLKVTQLRLKELKLLGYKHDPVQDLYTHPTIPITITLGRIDTDSDSIWDELIFDLEHFTPAVEPLVKDEQPVDNTESFLTHSAPQTAVNNSRFTIQPSTTFDDEPEIELEYVLVTSNYDSNHKWDDIEISPKYLIRLFPDEFAAEAVAGRTIGKDGKVQALNFAIMAR